MAQALARIPEASEQAKALEDVQGLPSREALAKLATGFTVSLRGAPFSRKDDMLVPAAGPCTTCPKRSGSSPALYDDLDGQDVCTDLKCYEGKCVANWDETSAGWAKKGATVLTIDDGKRLFKVENTLRPGGRFALADQPAQGSRCSSGVMAVISRHHTRARTSGSSGARCRSSSRHMACTYRQWSRGKRKRTSPRIRSLSRTPV